MSLAPPPHHHHLALFTSGLCEGTAYGAADLMMTRSSHAFLYFSSYCSSSLTSWVKAGRGKNPLRPLVHDGRRVLCVVVLRGEEGEGKTSVWVMMMVMMMIT